mmetsp:Transcript_82291/g.129591  ORF Transcript_82291/g.129591 Transcript_82291/m.129591 type:complete len:176 (-) Transcript_82291:276-803(-)|eukprot:CAMPEP_0169087274 /NCGR_PEP_ID=MMETSP1015-20121227/14144_1 /TAXON_ID=342587 /ORGANISM="Karlodinium micrum, Strain CCMP2283" /LENGTH=175 /DNA_ID=CAMNT_0009147493 /DNA_START=72 /DNA_END=599 /DNA_ORIENTATION=-
MADSVVGLASSCPILPCGAAVHKQQMRDLREKLLASCCEAESSGLIKPFDLGRVEDGASWPGDGIVVAPIRTSLLACDKDKTDADRFSCLSTAGDSDCDSRDISSTMSDDLSEERRNDFDDMIFVFDEEASSLEEKSSDIACVTEVNLDSTHIDLEEYSREDSNLLLADMFFFEN